MSIQYSSVRHILSLSGGKDSSALAVYMRDRIPEMEYVFCDTSQELVETYDYLDKLEAYLGKPIVRLKADPNEFDRLLMMRRNFLPSPKMRWCTQYLKIRPYEKYIGDEAVLSYVGIRSDENRKGYISAKTNIKAIYPFVEDGLVKSDIERILVESGLGIPKYYDWRSRSGCYFCFFQQRIEWVGLLENHPDLYQRAMDYEKFDDDTGKRYTWVVRESLEELKRPERVAQIKAEHQARMAEATKFRSNLPMAEVLAEEEEDGEEGLYHMRTVKPSSQSLGLSFARSLPLRRVNVAQVMAKVAEADGRNLSYKELYATSDLGSVEAQASKRWLTGFALSSKEDELTQFGRLVVTYDPTLSSISTQWVCHYNLLSPQRNGPSFWRWAWFIFVQAHDSVSKDEIASIIKRSSLESGEKMVSDDTYEDAARSFVNAYTSVDGLGNLHLLDESTSLHYQVGIPSEIPWQVFAYILADFWEANWGSTLSVPYADLSSDAGPGALLLLNSGQIGQLLRPMQETGLIEVSRVARPWTVLRRWQSKDDLLEAVYTHDDGA